MFFEFRKRLGNEQHDEALCRRCGRCCHGKIEVDGVVYFTPEVCPYYVEDSRSCRIYRRRFAICSDCISIDEAIERYALPEDCPYVRDIPGYAGPRPYSELIAAYGEDALARFQD